MYIEISKYIYIYIHIYIYTIAFSFTKDGCKKTLADPRTVAGPRHRGAALRKRLWHCFCSASIGVAEAEIRMAAEPKSVAEPTTVSKPKTSSKPIY